MCGEVGGSDEEIAAEYIKTMTKPVIGFIAGLTAPPGKRMGHAGAIISGTSGSPQAKVDALRAAGVHIAESTADIPGLGQASAGHVTIREAEDSIRRQSYETAIAWNERGSRYSEERVSSIKLHSPTVISYS